MASRRLAAMADKLLSFPVAEDEIEEVDGEGRPVRVVRKPGRWSFRDAAAVANVAAELSAAAISDGTAAAAEDEFDPVLATQEERSEYLKLHRVHIENAVRGKPAG